MLNKIGCWELGSGRWLGINKKLKKRCASDIYPRCVFLLYFDACRDRLFFVGACGKSGFSLFDLLCAVYVRKAGRRNEIIVGRDALFSGRVLQDTLRSVALFLICYMVSRSLRLCVLHYIYYV